LDMDADIGETKAILEKYISDGHLLLESELWTKQFNKFTISEVIG